MSFAGSGNPPELVYRVFTREVSSSLTQNTHWHTLPWRHHPTPTPEISCSFSLNPLICKRAKDHWVWDILKCKKLSFLCLCAWALFQVYNKHFWFFLVWPLQKSLFRLCIDMQISSHNLYVNKNNHHSFLYAYAVCKNYYHWILPTMQLY